MQWYYSSNGVQQGPVNWAALVAMASLGQLKPSDMLWTEGQPEWQPAGSFPGLVFANPANSATDPNLKWIVPIGQSGWAIAASYLGLFSVTLIFAPFAILAGILALLDIKNHPERGGKGRAIFGIVMGVIFTGFLGFLIISSYTHQY